MQTARYTIPNPKMELRGLYGLASLVRARASGLSAARTREGARARAGGLPAAWSRDETTKTQNTLVVPIEI